MKATHADYEFVSEIFRTRKQREAFYVVSVCGGLCVLTLLLAVVF
ncbi:MAG TPA: hypothetical protein VMW24_21330 [Sedimentisphaerales bacterium]|nr:hypothetical protein [Sedimentisphaerales bacterium]